MRYGLTHFNRGFSIHLCQGIFKCSFRRDFSFLLLLRICQVSSANAQSLSAGGRYSAAFSPPSSSGSPPLFLERFGFGAGSGRDGSGGRIGVLIFENAKYPSLPTSFKNVWHPQQFQWKLLSLTFGQNVDRRQKFGGKS